MAIYTLISRGKHSLGYDPHTLISRGKHGYLQSYTHKIFGRHRIANDALNVYELYRGAGSQPDFSATPFETFAALPHTTAALAANQTYYFTLRKRNKFNLISQNVASWIVVVDVSGNQSFISPTAPTNIRIQAAAGGAVRVLCEYAYAFDGTNQATQFLIYTTSNGVDPDPSTDTPAVVTMAKNDGISKLDYLSPTFADGLTIKALVRTRRIETGPVNVDSLSTNIVSVVSDTDGPIAPTGNIFFGKMVSQR